MTPPKRNPTSTSVFFPLVFSTLILFSTTTYYAQHRNHRATPPTTHKDSRQDESSRTQPGLVLDHSRRSRRLLQRSHHAAPWPLRNPPPNTPLRQSPKRIPPRLHRRPSPTQATHAPTQPHSQRATLLQSSTPFCPARDRVLVVEHDLVRHRGGRTTRSDHRDARHCCNEEEGEIGKSGWGDVQ
jgi:hypothetical protein